MRKIIGVFIVVICVASPTIWAESRWFPLEQGSGVIEEPFLTTFSSDLERISFDLDIPGVLVKEVETKKAFFPVLSLPGQSYTENIGQAQLPMIRKLVEIPYGAKVRIDLLKSDYTEYSLAHFGIKKVLAPVQESIIKTADGRDRWTFSLDQKYYSEDIFSPEKIVSVTGIKMYRAHRGVQISITPVLYNPVKKAVRIYSFISFDIVFEGSDIEKTFSELKRSWSPNFEEYYSQLFLNYGMFAGKIANSKDGAKTSFWDGILIISDPAYFGAADELAQWRRQMGYKVEHVDTSTAGTTTTAIKNYIQNAYDTWTSPSLSYVLLVGEESDIPAPDGSNCSNCASDSDYACLSGSDNIHDVYIGRISLANTTEATEVFDRFMTFTKAEFVQTSWLKKMCFSCSCDNSYNTYDTHESIQATYTGPGGNPGDFTGQYYPGASDPGGDLIRCIEDYGSSATSSGADVVNAMNNGRSMIVYSGHGAYTYWAGPEVDQTDLQNATCGEMAPFMVGHCCIAHNIRTATCFGEACVREVAVGYWGSSESSYWGEDDYIEEAWFKNIFVNNQLRMGDYMINAMVDFYQNYSTSREDYYMDMVILGGDPSMEIYTEIPLTLDVTHASSLQIGQSNFSVHVERDGSALAGARVCLTKNNGGDTIHDFGTTNGSGDVTITMSPSPASVGTLQVTVTAQNSIPYEGTATVIVPAGPWLSYESHLIDDSAGNNDGIANPGETIIIAVTLNNSGAEGGTGIEGILSETSSYCTITDGSALYPNIAVSSSGQSLSNHFAFALDGGTPNGEKVDFTLDWTAAGGYRGDTSFTVTVCQEMTISNVQSSNVTGNSATITWTTDVLSDSKVFYGTSVGAMTDEVTSSTAVLAHSIEITGLSECSSYYFAVESSSSNCYTVYENNAGAAYPFTTGTNVQPTYTSNDTPLAISDNSTITSTISVADNKPVLDVDVTINITHTYDADLDIFLIAPDNRRIELTTDNGSGGDNFVATRFDDDGLTAITAGTAPFTGSFIPEGSLTTLNNMFAFGDWTLEVSDDAGSDTGSLSSWSIHFVYPAQACAPHAAYSGHALIGDSCSIGGSGDGDSIWDAGEEIQFSISLKNDGSEQLSGITANLTALTAGVTITDGTADYATLDAGNSGSSLYPHFTVTLSDLFICDETIDFQIDILTDQGSWTDTFNQSLGDVGSGGGTILSENFDSAGIPSTWTIVDGSNDENTWFTDNTSDPGGCANTDPASPISGNWAAVDSDCAGSIDMDEELITPVLDLTGATSVTLEFDHYYHTYGPEYADVDVRSTKTGGLWVNIEQWTGTDTINPKHESFDISTEAAGASDVEIRWHYYNANFEWYWYIDNVIVSYTAPGGCSMNACEAGAPPGETAGTTSTAAVWQTGSSTMINWGHNPDADFYRVYRGTPADLANLENDGIDSCLRQDNVLTDYIDGLSEVPNAGSFFWYLITAVNAYGEGTCGSCSSGPRVMDSSGDCP